MEVSMLRRSKWTITAGAVALLVAVGISVNACTPALQIRTKAEVSERSCEYDRGIGVSPECRNYSIEDHQKYLLSVVEFDDQGWFRDRRQQDLLLATLEREANQHQLIIVVYVHGW